MTYGEIRYRLAKLAPGVDLALIDGWMQDRYREMLDELPWQRLQAVSTIQTVAEYNTGTVTATNGLTTINGVGTAWTSAMTGRMIRIAGRPEFYEFTYIAPASGSLDRGFEGASGGGQSYRINKSSYALPLALRFVTGVRSNATENSLSPRSTAELNELAPVRDVYGPPETFSLAMDQTSDPPLAQIELYPIPTEVHGYLIDQEQEGADLTAGATAVSLLPWTRPGALLAGVQADIAIHLKDDSAADRYELRFKRLLGQMVRNECFLQGPSPLRMTKGLVAHRRRRWTR